MTTKWKDTFAFERAIVYWDSRCAYCLKQELSFDLTKDHFIPKSRSGPNNAFNYIPACKTCNNNKGDMHPNSWCSDDVRAHITRYINWLMYNDAINFKSGKIDGRKLEAQYNRYRLVREKINTKAKNIRLVELLYVENNTIHWSKQIRDAICRERFTGRRIQYDDGDVWRTSDGRHILH